MTIAPANISDCTEPVNSGRNIQTGVMSITVSYLATYDPPGASSLKKEASATKTWGRKTFPKNGNSQSPGDDLFFMAQDCCAPCRARFAFDDEDFNSDSVSAGNPIFGYEFTQTTQELDDEGNPVGEPIVQMFDAFLQLKMWIRADAPARTPDGPQNDPVARMYIPEDFLHVPGENQVDEDAGDTITTSVTGTYGVEIDESGFAPVFGYQPFIFRHPEPCSNTMEFSVTVVRTWTIENYLSATSSVTATFALG